VFFGATGDLAHKMIFPALYRMVKRNALEVPVIGVASSTWTVEQLAERARDGIEQFGGGVHDEEAFQRLVSLLGYVDGDYTDKATYAALVKALHGATRPANYLAIPPACSDRGRRARLLGHRGARPGHRGEAVRA